MRLASHPSLPPPPSGLSIRVSQVVRTSWTFCLSNLVCYRGDARVGVLGCVRTGA